MLTAVALYPRLARHQVIYFLGILDKKTPHCGRKWAAIIGLAAMKSRIPIYPFIIASLCAAILSATPHANAQVNVTQFHNHDSRDGLYLDPAFTLDAAANLARDLD